MTDKYLRCIDERLQSSNMSDGTKQMNYTELV